MSALSGDAASAPSLLRLGGYDFTFVATLIPERDVDGAIREFSPQARYSKSHTVPLHKYGHGTFCRFHITVPQGLAGVYALVVNGTVHYIGECEDLGKRFNMGYGNISPKNCYQGGQTTNCKINRRVLEISQIGVRLDVYFCPTPQRQTVEKHLIAHYSPPWNG